MTARGSTAAPASDSSPPCAKSGEPEQVGPFLPFGYGAGSRSQKAKMAFRAEVS
jgi:hypothetical protein